MLIPKPQILNPYKEDPSEFDSSWLRIGLGFRVLAFRTTRISLGFRVEGVWLTHWIQDSGQAGVQGLGFGGGEFFFFFWGGGFRV